MKQQAEMSMVNPSTDDLTEKVGSRYGLVVLAARRAREILVEEKEEDREDDSMKNVTKALNEILEDKITYSVGGDEEEPEEEEALEEVPTEETEGENA